MEVLFRGPVGLSAADLRDLSDPVPLQGARASLARSREVQSMDRVGSFPPLAVLERSDLHRIRTRLIGFASRLRLDRLRVLDPNPVDRPVSRVALLVFAAGICVNLSFFLRCRAQPMMDFFMHAAHVRYVAEWGRNDSLYAGLFERPDLLAANTLFYSVGGTLAKVFNPLAVARFLIGFLYIAGYPLVMLYSLRTFGRSIWGAVLANALVFERFYIAGFAAELIGYPLSLLAIT